MKCGNLACGLRLIYRHIADKNDIYRPALIYVAEGRNRGLQTVVGPQALRLSDLVTIQ